MKSSSYLLQVIMPLAGIKHLVTVSFLFLFFFFCTRSAVGRPRGFRRPRDCRGHPGCGGGGGHFDDRVLLSETESAPLAEACNYRRAEFGGAYMTGGAHRGWHSGIRTVLQCSIQLSTAALSTLSTLSQTVSSYWRQHLNQNVEERKGNNKDKTYLTWCSLSFKWENKWWSVNKDHSPQDSADLKSTD